MGTLGDRGDATDVWPQLARRQWMCVECGGVRGSEGAEMWMLSHDVSFVLEFMQTVMQSWCMIARSSVLDLGPRLRSVALDSARELRGWHQTLTSWQ